jgi:hypothetical protein
MDYADYAELRRRAEKRLTILSIWPFAAFQVATTGLAVLFGPNNLNFIFVAGVGAFGLMLASAFIQRGRTAANRAVRRRAIDETLDDAVEMGWPLEDPTPRELRLMAALLDDDLEVRAGMGRVIVWSMASAWILWILTFFAAVSFSPSWQLAGLMGGLVLWISGLTLMGSVQQRARRASEARVRSALSRSSVWNPAKPKRSAEAPWWQEEADDAGKPKRVALDDVLSAYEGDDWDRDDAAWDARRASS